MWLSTKNNYSSSKAEIILEFWSEKKILISISQYNKITTMAEFYFLTINHQNYSWKKCENYSRIIFIFLICIKICSISWFWKVIKVTHKLKWFAAIFIIVRKFRMKQNSYILNYLCSNFFQIRLNLNCPTIKKMPQNSLYFAHYLYHHHDTS